MKNSEINAQVVELLKQVKPKERECFIFISVDDEDVKAIMLGPVPSISAAICTVMEGDNIFRVCVEAASDLIKSKVGVECDCENCVENRRKKAEKIKHNTDIN